jgi:CHASE2 domain-containing sensor protein
MALRIPSIEQSFLGQPDREMLKTAFRLRSDVFTGLGSPVLLVDIDNASIAPDATKGQTPGREPPAAVSRELLARIIEYILSAPAEHAPRVVVLDADVASAGIAVDPGTVHLHRALAAWAANPRAPQLVISRETFPVEVLDAQANPLPPGVEALPASAYDDVVAPARNIRWGTSRMLADQDGVVREILPYQCVAAGGRIAPLYSVAIEAYRAVNPGGVGGRSNTAHWIRQATRACAAKAINAVTHGEPIDYHLALTHADVLKPLKAATLPPDWPGYRVCGSDGESAVFRRVSASLVADAGNAGRGNLLCQRLVLIGGTNDVAADFHQTPLNDMAGPMVIANALRGLEISHGGLRTVPLVLQMLLFAVVSLAITTGFSLSRHARRHYRNRRAASQDWGVRMLLLPLNPVLLNWVAGFIAHYFGVAVLVITLNIGFSGFLSGPAFMSAMAEAVQDFTEED